MDIQLIEMLSHQISATVFLFEKLIGIFSNYMEWQTPIGVW